MKSFNRIRCLNKVVSEIIDEYNLIDVVVADIGTDHGYLSELLSRNKKIKKVFATDISQKCLDKTNQLISKCNIEKIETKLGDGLDAVDVVDLAVVAGIGGYEIINMISNQNITINNTHKCEIFVFQPSKNTPELRSYLMDNNIAIVKDFIVKSGGKFYPIIVADLSKNNSLNKDIFNLYFGCSNTLEDGVFIEYLNDLIFRLSFCENLKKNKIFDDESKIKIEIFELAKKLLKKYKGD